MLSKPTQFKVKFYTVWREDFHVLRKPQGRYLRPSGKGIPDPVWKIATNNLGEKKEEEEAAMNSSTRLCQIILFIKKKISAGGKVWFTTDF